MEREVVCGADIHKQFLLATILSNDGQKFQDRFDTNFEGLLNFRQWLLNLGCQKLAVESTASYWLPIYLVLGKDVEFILANAYQIKHIPGRKTDVLDSEWIAELCLKDLIAPSRIFSEDERDLRAMTRTRESYVKMRTQTKNRNSSGTGISMYQALISSFRYFRQNRNPYHKRHTKRIEH